MKCCIVAKAGLRGNAASGLAAAHAAKIPASHNAKELARPAWRRAHPRVPCVLVARHRHQLARAGQSGDQPAGQEQRPFVDSVIQQPADMASLSASERGSAAEDADSSEDDGTGHRLRSACDGTASAAWVRKGKTLSPRPWRQQLQRDILAGCKRLRRSQMSSWRKLRKEKRLLRVPWRGGMVLQICSGHLALDYLGTFLVVIGLYLFWGLQVADLTPKLQGMLHLMLGVMRMGSTLALLRASLRQHRQQLRQDGWFPMALHPLGRWLLPTGLACLLFPAVIFPTAVLLELLPPNSSPTIRGYEQMLGKGDLVMDAVHLLLMCVCAPIWEEVVFRGFLLPSFGRWLPMPGAIAASAAVFAVGHLKVPWMLSHLLLGGLLGLLFVHTRNLLAPIVLHSAWNLLIFVCLIHAAP